MPQNYDFIITVLRLLCPYLKAMAARTDNKIDDLVVDFICKIVNNKEGGD